MPLSMNVPKPTNWWVWGGAAAAAIIVIGALGYWFDWFGTGATEAAAPTVEQSVPATE